MVVGMNNGLKFLEDDDLAHINRQKTCPDCKNIFLREHEGEGNYYCEQCSTVYNLRFNTSGQGPVIYIAANYGKAESKNDNGELLKNHPLWLEAARRATAKPIPEGMTEAYLKYKKLPKWAKHVMSKKLGWQCLGPQEPKKDE